tara:strand:- start:198 stop:809 length:612 start_codon:yes stop_codon:yes gene_type:complete
MGYKYNGSPLPLDVAWTDTAGAQYPANWLRGSNEAERAAVPSGGVVWEGDPIAYDSMFYNGVNDPKDLSLLKAHWVNVQKTEANRFLSKTDWKVIRAAEGGTALPSADATYRANVRTQSGLREATINACADVDKLKATILRTLPPTIAGTASNGATEKFDTSKEKKDGSGNSFDPKQYESFDPKQYNDIANPDLLEDWPTPPS